MYLFQYIEDTSVMEDFFNILEVSLQIKLMGLIGYCTKIIPLHDFTFFHILGVFNLNEGNFRRIEQSKFS